MAQGLHLLCNNYNRPMHCWLQTLSAVPEPFLYFFAVQIYATVTSPVEMDRDTLRSNTSMQFSHQLCCITHPWIRVFVNHYEIWSVSQSLSTRLVFSTVAFDCHKPKTNLESGSVIIWFNPWIRCTMGLEWFWKSHKAESYLWNSFVQWLKWWNLFLRNYWNYSI